MWAAAVCGVVAAGAFVSWRRSGLKLFDYLQLHTMYLFGRLWHRAHATGPCPVPAAGPAIVVANHPSHADPAFLMATCPRLVHFLQAREAYDVFLLRRLFRRIGCIPVARDGRDYSAVRTALRRLEEGEVLGLFPEGEVRNTGEPPKRGMAFLALRSRAPVVPALIAGASLGQDMLTAWLWPSGGVRVTYGPPVDLAVYYDRPITRELVQEVTKLIMRRVADLGALDRQRTRLPRRGYT